MTDNKHNTSTTSTNSPAPCRYGIEMDIGGAWERLPEDSLYNTREEAEQEIKDHITNCINAMEGGELDDSPDQSNFRVVEVV